MKKEKVDPKKSLLIGKPLKIPNISIYELFKRRSKINASKVVCRCHENELTFLQLQAQSEIYAKAFLELGIKCGDIVPLCVEPSCVAVVLFFALNRIGAVSTFLNATAGEEEIKKYIRLFHSNTLILSDRLELNTRALQKECGLTRSIIVNRKDIVLDNTSVKLDEILKLGQNSTLMLTQNYGSDVPAFIAYTSGTTGEPKSILLSNGNIIAEMLSLAKTTRMQYGPQGNSLQVVPFNYPYGFIISVLFPVFVGKTAALTPALTVETTAEYLKMYKPKYISAIPPFYKSFLKDERIGKMNLSFLKYPVSGGDIITKSEIERINLFLKKHGSKGKLLNGSGNGEGCGSLTNPIALFGQYNINSIGKAIYGLSVKFVDDNGCVVSRKQKGRFCFSGKNLMLCYYNDETATRAVKYMDDDGIEWFHTDTYGYMDEKNWIYFAGRGRRFFITYDSKGSPYKVYCDHVQNVIKKHCNVSDCVVVKRTDERRYFVPVAFVTTISEEWVKTREEIEELCYIELQHCAVPCEYIHINELPISNAGKIDYLKLEKIAEKKENDKGFTGDS